MLFVSGLVLTGIGWWWWAQLIHRHSSEELAEHREPLACRLVSWCESLGLTLMAVSIAIKLSEVMP